MSLLPTTASEANSEASSTAKVRNNAVVGIEPMGPDTIQGSVRAMFPMRNSVGIIHGGVGCTFYARFFLTFVDNINMKLLGTLFEADDVVFGGNKTLETALEKVVDVYRPELIVLSNACVPLLIGDDVHGISKRLSKKNGVKIVCVDNANYTGNEIDGYLNVAKEYVKQLMEKKGAVKERTVNLIGTMPAEYNWKRDVKELKRLLTALGLEVNCTFLGPQTYPSEIANAPQAQANVMLFPEIGLPVARLMKDSFETPYIETKLPPVGIEATKEWLIKIGEFFGLEKRVAKLIDEELDNMAEPLAELSAGDCYNLAWLFGKTYAMESMPFWIPAMVKCLREDLSLYPRTLAFQQYHQDSFDRLQEVLKELDLSPEVQTSGDYYEFKEAIARDHHYPWGDPWFVFGSTYTAVFSSVTNTRVPVFPWSTAYWDKKIVTDRPFVGFRGVVTMAEEIHNLLQQKAWMTVNGLPDWTL